MASVLITGGSRGIGAAAVRAFAARGDQVTFLYEKNHEAAQAVAKETGATAICADISDHAAVAAAFAGLRSWMFSSTTLESATMASCPRLLRRCGTGSLPSMSGAPIFALRLPSPCFCRSTGRHHQRIQHVGGRWALPAKRPTPPQRGHPGPDKGSGQGAGALRHPGQCCRSRRHPHRYGRPRGPGGAGSSARGNPIGAQREAGGRAKAMVYLAGAEFITGQILPVNGGFVIT